MRHRYFHVAVFKIITFLIHAIVQAIASLLLAVFTHLVPALLAVVALLALLVAVCTTCGVSGFAFLRRRRKQQD
ncbi:hypothetical protein [Terriglobus roseus]|uniref:Uncharacterized protein n=1 Tax=Terriglobus roseus TaxID=392734 RepID=A0A1H4MC81_9BACT|nr:hypothetical protein [Terriglobus roseus]SEB80710.1 hypothetical protein SAMN05443244_1890 [Terriglobus roseus]